LQEGVPEKRGENHGTLAKIRVSLLSVEASQPPVHQGGKAPHAGFPVKHEIRIDRPYLIF